MARPGPTLEELLIELRDADSDVRQNAAEALGGFGAEGRGALTALVEIAKNDDDTYVRWTAIEALGELGDAAVGAVDALTELLADEDYQGAAAEALAEIGSGAVTSLAGALKHADPDVRRAAGAGMVALGIKARPAVPQLIEALRDRSDRVRIRAVESLGNAGNGIAQVPRELCRILLPSPCPK